GAKFTTREHDPDLFCRLTAFVSQVTVAEGFAYKDVIQPFVVSAWPGLRSFGALRIRHNLADVAFSMLAQKWYYPEAAVGPIGPGVPPIQPPGSAIVSYTPTPSSLDELEVRVIRGIVLADRALACVDAVTVDYDDLIWNEETLRAALSTLYPGADVSQVRYIDEGFCYRREALLQRRTVPRYRALQQMIATIEAEPLFSVNR
ncbi:MAG TPA: hypothetical protein VHB98_15000, partial [Chloroflexota bacterium]|nr:hypothetical protein [Chloroflexota bacterium]